MTDSETELMVADIGGTNARFARYVGTRRIAEIVLPSASHQTAVALVKQGMDELGIRAPSACCIAVAGPVKAGVAGLTNRGLQFDRDELQRSLGFLRCAVINDLVALAEAIAGMPSDAARQIGGAANRQGSRAVIAPGTGLGMAFALSWAEELHCIPSEGGHSPFAPADPLEQEVLAFLAARDGYVSWESVASGPGLVNLYKAVCHVWGSAPETELAETVAERALDLSDPVCHQALTMFCSVLGSAAGMLAVTACADAGIYIGGGIVPRIVDFLAESGFRRRFDERGPLTDYVAAIPVFVILDDRLALDGAAACAARLLQQPIE